MQSTKKYGVDTHCSPFIYEEELDMKMIHDVDQKKQNVAMWDNIDALTMKFVQDLQDAGLGGQHLDEDLLLDTSKDVLEVILPVVEKATGKEFVFVDCDY